MPALEVTVKSPIKVLLCYQEYAPEPEKMKGGKPAMVGRIEDVGVRIFNSNIVPEVFVATFTPSLEASAKKPTTKDPSRSSTN